MSYGYASKQLTDQVLSRTLVKGIGYEAIASVIGEEAASAFVTGGPVLTGELDRIQGIIDKVPWHHRKSKHDPVVVGLEALQRHNVETRSKPMSSPKVPITAIFIALVPVLRTAVSSAFKALRKNSPGGSKITPEEAEELAITIGIKLGEVVVREIKRANDG